MSDDVRRQAADHEAGHYMIATLSPAEARVHWVTLERRPGTNSGGSNGTEWITLPSRSWTVRHALAGAIAQGLGASIRAGNTLSPETLDALLVSASDDLKDIVPGELESEMPACVKLIAEHWADCSAISDALMTHETPFFGEPELVIRADKDDAWSPVLVLYRVFRREIEPPPGWCNGETMDHPSGPFYEGYDVWLQRVPPRENESVSEWTARLQANRLE